MATPPASPFAPTILIAAPGGGAKALRHLLSAHPAINIAAEFDFLVEAVTQDGRFMKRDAFLRSIEFNGRFKKLGFNLPQDMNFAGLAQAMLAQVAAAKPGASVVGFTLQKDFDRILWLWPDARFIHLVRDGRDVALGNAQTRRAGNMWHGIEDWAEVETLWDRMSHKLPFDRQHTVRFETLATDTEDELRRLCEFLGVPFEPVMLQQAPFLARERHGQWRKADPAEVSFSEHRAARWLLQNGYFLSGTVRPLSAMRRARLNLQNKLTLANRRRELLGTGLWLKGVLTNRFGGRKAKAKMKRRQFDLLSRAED
jgi:hypothetical protein